MQYTDSVTILLNERRKIGTRHGLKIIYEGEGPHEANKRPCDVIVIIESFALNKFLSEGDDLIMTMHS